MSAEIRVWMLTGDKRETAVNIARSCGLCTQRTTELQLNTKNFADTGKRLGELIEEAVLLRREKEEFTLIIDGTVCV